MAETHPGHVSAHGGALVFWGFWSFPTKFRHTSMPAAICLPQRSIGGLLDVALSEDTWCVQETLLMVGCTSALKSASLSLSRSTPAYRVRIFPIELAGAPSPKTHSYSQYW